MIGKNILTPRHLAKHLVLNTPAKVFFTPDNRTTYAGIVLKINTTAYKEKIVFFTSCISDESLRIDRLSPTTDKEVISIANNLSKDYPGVVMNKWSDTTFVRGIQNVTLLPADFEEKWNAFVTSNKKAFDAFQGKYGILSNKTSNGKAQYIFSLTGDSKNFFFWAVEASFRARAYDCQIKEILLWNEKYSQLSSKLSRGSITSYTNFNQFYQLGYEIRVLRREKRITDVMNSFNTQQKKLLKALDKSALTKRDKEAFSKFANLSLTKRMNFIRKMSTIEDAATILKHLRHVTNTLFEWTKESFMDYLANTPNVNINIVKDDGDIVLVEVKDYDTVKRLAKNTNWCISKNKKYWNDYVERKSHAKQYMLFNFGCKEDDTYAIVGFTSLADNGITNAHDFVNNNLMGNPESDEQYKSYFTRFDGDKNIFSILKTSNVPISLVTEITPFSFNWAQKDFLQFLYSCVSKHNVHILLDKDDKLCLSVQDANLRYVLGQSYINHTESYDYQLQHILFLDFTLPSSSPEAFYYAIIYEDASTYECYPGDTRNPKWLSSKVSFNQLLTKYGLPYDIIRRINDPYSMFKDEFENGWLDLSVINDQTREWLKKMSQEAPNMFFETLYHDTHYNLCFDRLHWIYNHGFTLTELMGQSNTIALISEALNNLRLWSRTAGKDGNIPQKSDIKQFWEETLESKHMVGFVGYYSLVMLLIENEHNNSITIGVLRKLQSRSFPNSCPLIQTILGQIAMNINYSTDDNALSYFIPLVYNHSCEEIIKMIETLPTMSEFGKNAINTYRVRKTVNTISAAY